MIRFIYRNNWIADYSGEKRDISWLKKQFSYVDLKDFQHKKRFGYFPKYCTLGEVISHGQVIHAIRCAKEENIPFEIVDNTERYLLETGSIDKSYLPNVELRDYQALASQVILGKGHGIVKVGTGGGKCLGLGTNVLLFDGNIKKVEDVIVGDLLMGPDNKPRKVLSTCRGRGNLFQIKPVKGDPWICNDVHVLTLKHTVTGEIIDIPLNEYINKCKKFKHCYKQFIQGVDFNEQKLPLDPYFLGVWLGDGTKSLKGIGITKEDDAIVKCVYEIANLFQLKVHPSSSGGRCITWNISRINNGNNPLLDLMRDLMKDGICIPKKYLLSSKNQRLQLLAGLLDTDGYLKKTNCFEIVQKNKDIAGGIIFLARSLGFMTTRTKKIVNGQEYQRIVIAGDINEIPTRIPRKQAGKRLINKDACRSGFTVNPIGEGEYAGFELDGDGRFLLGDFVVTHNTVIMGTIVKQLFENTNVKGILILILSKDLLNQTAKRFESYGVPTEEIGIIHSDYSPKEQLEASKKRIVLSTHLSITKFQGVIEKTEYVINDECHKSKGNLWSALFGMLPNIKNIIGFTATPWDDDKEKFNMLAIYGQILVDIPAKWLIKNNYLMKPEIFFIKIHYKDRDIKLLNAMDWREAEQQLIIEEKNRNLLPIVTLQKFGGRMLVLYDKLDHGEILFELYQKHGFEIRLAEGKTKTKDREEAINWFEKPLEKDQRGKVLLASRVFDEGIDIKGGCDLGFIIGGGKDESRQKQRIGRLLRKNSTGIVKIFDIQDTNHGILSRWSGIRRKAIEEETDIKPKIIEIDDFVKM